MSRLTTWRPRASGLGAYLLCDYRAALDRALAEGTITLPDAGTPPPSSGYAELGTLIHHRMQMALGCDWPKGHVHEDFAPTFALAAQLFAGDLSRTDAAVQAACNLALKELNAAYPPSTGKWKAEKSVRMGNWMTGHIDLLAPDEKVIVDLKTTARKPDHNRMKGEHMVQLLAYSLMVPTAAEAAILYVDSTKAAWSMLIKVDLLDPAVVEYRDQIHAYIRYLRGSNLGKFCTPKIGSHCSSTFCPWVGHCRDRVLPAAGIPNDALPFAAPVGGASPL